MSEAIPLHTLTLKARVSFRRPEQPLAKTWTGMAFQMPATVSEVVLTQRQLGFSRLTWLSPRLSSRSEACISEPMCKIIIVQQAISLGDGGVFMLMALVLETPYRHWHNKVVHFGLLRISPLTVGLIWIRRHGYRRRRVSLLFKWHVVPALPPPLGIQTVALVLASYGRHTAWHRLCDLTLTTFSVQQCRSESRREYDKYGPVIVHSECFLGSTDGHRCAYSA